VLRQTIVLPLLVVTALASGSCQVVGGYEVFERSAPTPTPRTRECDVIESPKSGQAGALLVLVDDPDATCFWMDETEVSVGDYRSWLGFLDGNVPDWEQDECGDLKSANAHPFDPDQGDPSCEVPEPRPSNPDPFDETLPIRCVNWCEADAYCRWAGKRLCKVAQSMPTSNDEWQIACSAGYTQTYPFDPSAQGHPCNFGQNCASGCGPLPVAQDTQCRPREGYPLNLGGNVAEWVDRPTFTRGGSYLSPQKDLACTNTLGFNGARERNARVGFRCCASLTSDERTQLPD